MHIIVVGCGDVGSQLASLLSVDGHDVAVIDKDPGAFRRLGATFNGVTFAGYGFDGDVLKEAGIERCEAFAAVTNQDNSNMMACEMASKIFKVPHAVARLYNAERETAFLQLGLDYVCATTMIAHSVMEKLVAGHGRHLVVRKDVEMFEFSASHALHGKMVKDVQIPNEFRICLVTRDGASFIPWHETILRDHDLILALLRFDAHSRIVKYVRKAH